MSEDVNAAELRRALEAPPGQQWTSMTPGRSAVQTEPTFVIVSRSTLKAVLDAYEQRQGHPTLVTGNPNRKASPHGRVHGQEPGEAAAPSGGDDLTALLRRELSAGPCNRCGGTCLDAEAARLAEVVREHEAEAVGLLREVLDHGDAFDAPFCVAVWEKARAFLARREEATDA